MSKLRNEKGVTLIELVIGIAIMLVLSVAIGSLVVTVTKNYKLSTTQTILITEASNTKNQLTNMIMDATDAVAYLSAEGNFEDLQIVNGGVVRTIHYNENEEKIYVITDTLEELLAEHVTYFKVNDADFEENKTISFEVGYKFENLIYNISFQATSRNELPGEINSFEAAPYFTIKPKELYLEPNQEYLLNVKLNGGSGKYSVEVVGSSTYNNNTGDENTRVSIESNGKLKINIGKDETGNSSGIIYLKFSSDEKNGNNKPVATAVVTIRIRRITGIKASLRLMAGDPGKKGAVYEATGFCYGTNLEKLTTNEKTKDVDPKAIHGQFYMYVDGKLEEGNRLFHYIDITSMDAKNARIEFKVDMPANSELRVQVFAEHPNGHYFDSTRLSNVTGKSYDFVEDWLILKKPEEGMTPVITDPGFKRSDEYFIKDGNGNDLYASSNILMGLNYSDYNAANTLAKVKRWIYRFREITKDGYGEWVPFRMTVEKGTAAKLNKSETLRFEPDKYYQVQFVYAAFDDENKVLYYPISDDILKEAGFEGYSAGWKSNQPQMEEDKYIQADFNIAPVEVSFELTGLVNETGYIGTINEPYDIKKNGGNELHIMTSYIAEKKYLDIIIQEPSKTEQYEWDKYDTCKVCTRSVEKTVTNGNEKYSKINLSNLGATTSTHRVLVGINWPIYSNGEKLTDIFDGSSFFKENRYYKLYDDMDTGNGLVYFNIID